MPLRFSLRQLEYFQAVAETGSIAAASDRVNVSSPSISAAIALLEEEFGLELFVRRHARGLALTSGGAEFLAQARRVLTEAGRLTVLANDVTGKVRGPLHVGCFLTFAQFILPQLRKQFVARHPEVEFRQYERPHTDLIEGLRNATLDIALTYDLDVPAGMTFTPLLTLPPFAVMAEGHPMARRKTVSPKDLLSHPMVLLDLPASADYFLSLFARAGSAPRIIERTRDMAVMQSLVANGFGYSLVNIRPLSARSPDGRKLRYLPLTGNLRALKLGLLQAGDARPVLTVKAFASHCMRSITEASAPGILLKAPPARHDD
jgi:DNA-binding transcriptional LysR family regulator